MQKSTKAKIFTGIATATLAVASLFNAHLQSPTTIVNNNPNVVYIATGANGQEIIGVLDDANISTSLSERGATIVETSAFVVVPPIDEITANFIETGPSLEIAPPENPTYLPTILNAQFLYWPVDRSRTGYWRPAPGGVSIGHPKVTAGTLGGRICYEGYGCNCFVTNAHVAGGLNGAKVGDSILQPGPHDGGKAGDEIGKIVAIVSPKKGVNNVVDVAIACGSAETVYPEIYGIGRVDNIYPEPYIGMKAVKCGRTTGCTVLTLIGKEVTVKVGYLIGKNWVIYTFVHQLLWSGKSAPGDSGSEIVTDHLWDALLFAGNDDEQVMSNDPDYIFQSIPGAYLPGMQARAEAYP